MSDRTIVIEKIPLVKENAGTEQHFLEMSLSYSLGGTDYASMKPAKRGYFLHATPMFEKEGISGMKMRGFTLCAGLKAFVEPAGSFRAKRLADLAKTLKSDPLYEKVKEAVILKENLTLANTETV